MDQPNSVPQKERKVQLRSIRTVIVTAFLALFIIVGITEFVAYLQVNRLNEGKLKGDFQSLQDQSKSMLNATKEFMLFGKNDYDLFTKDSTEVLTRYAIAFAKFKEASDQTRAELYQCGYNDLSELDQLDAAIIELDTLFKEYKNTTKVRGNDLFGTLSEFNAALEFLAQFDFGVEQKELLEMRLENRKYQLSGDTTIIDYAIPKVNRFVEIAKENLDSNMAPMVLGELNSYESSLNSLVAIDKRLGIYSGAGLQGKLTQQIDVVEDAVKMASMRNKVDEAYVDIVNNVVLSLIVIFGVTLVCGGLITLLLFKRLVNPLQTMQRLINSMSLGVLPNEIPQYKTQEVKEIARSVGILVDGLQRTSAFAGRIGEGEFDTDYKPLSEQDILGNSLLVMRDNLHQLSQEEVKRNWSNEGYGRFMEILRSTNNDSGQLANKLLPELIRFLKANQGALYVLEDNDQNDLKMQMIGCYAWDRTKHLDQKISMDDGLIGQAWREQERIYITDVPDNFIQISSGLGESNPKAILILPLKFNETIFGILEIASFYLFEDHQLEFLERLAESIASTLSNTKTNERTNRLLDELKVSTESLQAQEEELRQNQEEMIATHEELERKLKEYEGRLASKDEEIAQLKTTETPN